MHHNTLHPATQIVFVADLFLDEYIGGAELTSDALLSTSPFNVQKIHSRDVTLELLQEGSQKFWIFANWSQLNLELIPTIIGNLAYSILEYDYKYCKYRSPEKHFAVEGVPCACHDDMHGKVTSAFYYAARNMFWMSEKQKDRYTQMFPFLEQGTCQNTILSSVFDNETLTKIRALRESIPVDQRLDKMIVLGSQSWIKGTEAAVTWCKNTHNDYEVVSGLSYDEMLAKLATSRGIVYLPQGGDTCPRFVIEAKLLGCEVHINENVQHAAEDWFNIDDLDSVEDYLRNASDVFWSHIKDSIEWPKISGYTTTYNCVKQEYPFIQSINSMLGFCDEVCICDAGSTDDTLKEIALLKYPTLSSDVVESVLDEIIVKKFPDRCGDLVGDSRIRVKVIKRDWSKPRSALYDGMQKAEARKMCTGDLCWQMDIDEIVHESQYELIRQVGRSFNRQCNILALPVIEYWGGEDKVRIDVTPWKWRLSRNDPMITHGVPLRLRSVDASGELIALPGTDGCDMIHATTFEVLPFVTFWQPQFEDARRKALTGDKQALIYVEALMNQIAVELPCVYHYSWYDIERKMKLYRDFWTRHWNDLCGKDYVDTPESNMMFDVAWKDVTDEMIVTRANELRNIGGWIWHKKHDGTQTPWIKINHTQPASMIKDEEW